MSETESEEQQSVQRGKPCCNLGSILVHGTGCELMTAEKH